MIYAEIVKQIVSYRPVADELKTALERVQKNNDIQSVFETKLHASLGCDPQGFIILYTPKEESEGNRC